MVDFSDGFIDLDDPLPLQAVSKDSPPALEASKLEASLEGADRFEEVSAVAAFADVVKAEMQELKLWMSAALARLQSCMPQDGGTAVTADGRAREGERGTAVAQQTLSELEDIYTMMGQPVSLRDWMLAGSHSLGHQDTMRGSHQQRENDEELVQHTSSEQRRHDWEQRMNKHLGRMVAFYEQPDAAADENVDGKMAARRHGTLRTRMLDFVDGKYFGLSVSVAILLNAIIIGMDVQSRMHIALNDPDSDNAMFYVIANYVFSAFFACELLLKLVAMQLQFIIGPGWQWNIFDAILVAISIADIFRSEDGAGLNTGYMRLLRVMRMARVLRIVRVFRIFRELRCMCMSILSCMTSIMWALFLLVLVVYIFAIVFMQAGVGDLEESRSNEHAWRRWYGSVGEAMFSLTKAVSGGENWSPMVEPLEDVNSGYTLLFTVYVLIIVFGALNVLTGVFLQRAVSTMNHDRDWITQEEKIKMERFVTNLMTLFNELDVDNSGLVRWEEFLHAMDDPSTQAFFSSHELDIMDAHLVFSTVADKDGNVSALDFIHGCTKAAGYAKSAHLMVLMKKFDALHVELKRAFEILKPATGSPAASPPASRRSVVGGEMLGVNKPPKWDSDANRAPAGSAALSGLAFCDAGEKDSKLSNDATYWQPIST